MDIKKYFFALAMSFRFCGHVTGQVVCIFCYDQNDSISPGVNNLLLNGSFESTNCIPEGGSFCPNSNGYNCDITNWTCTGGGSDTYACSIDNTNKSVIPEGTKAAYFGNWFCGACSATFNDTACISNTGCTVTGLPSGVPVNTSLFGGTAGVSLEQTVTGLVPCNTYILEFWAGGEDSPSEPFPNKGLFAVDVGFGNIMLRCKPTPIAGGIGTRYIIEFKATSASHTIKFTNWGHIFVTCTELVLDDVRLYTLAELSSNVTSCSSNITATASSTSAPGGTATIHPSGGTGIYTYLWNTEPPQTSQTAYGLAPGLYCCIVTDGGSCSDTVCVTVEAPCGTLFVPNVFSPNNDEANELECVFGECIETLHFSVYDRWGKKVFETIDQKKCWDGTYKGKPMNSAVFAYSLQATLLSGQQIIQKGNISLIR